VILSLFRGGPKAGKEVNRRKGKWISEDNKAFVELGDRGWIVVSSEWSAGRIIRKNG
jgi:hypothetical protein